MEDAGWPLNRLNGITANDNEEFVEQDFAIAA